MKALIWHCKKFEVKIVSKSNRPKNIIPEEQRMNKELMENCIVAMITVEKDDKIPEAINSCVDDIKQFARDTKSNNIVVMPFVHLSNNISNYKTALRVTELIGEKLEKDFNVLRSHFGYHKELLLHTFGHSMNVRYREF